MSTKLITQKFIMEYKNISKDKKIRIIKKICELDKKHSDFLKNLTEAPLQEVNWKVVGFVGGLSLVTLLSLWNENRDKRKKYNISWKKCKDKYKEDPYHKSKCDEVYYKEKEALEKKEKELKDKIKKVREIIKKKKAEEAKDKLK
jgi:hypothetical protein